MMRIEDLNLSPAFEHFGYVPPADYEAPYYEQAAVA
jgi:hypothetical protein